MTVDEIIENVIKICNEYQVKKVILFGSRAKGTATDRSDFDLAVSGVSDFEKLQDAIDEIPTLYSFDIINMDTCKNALLLKEIEEYGRKIL